MCSTAQFSSLEITACEEAEVGGRGREVVGALSVGGTKLQGYSLLPMRRRSMGTPTRRNRPRLHPEKDRMKRLNAVTLLCLVIPILVASPAALSAERMKSGKWEMTPTGGGPSHSSTQCITPQYVADMNGTPAELRAFVEKTSVAAKCTVQNFKMQGDTVSYALVCAGTTMDTTTVYHGDSYEVVMTSTAAGRAPKTSRVTAKRVGAC